MEGGKQKGKKGRRREDVGLRCKYVTLSVLERQRVGGWADASAVQHSCKGPESGSQHPCQMITTTGSKKPNAEARTHLHACVPMPPTPKYLFYKERNISCFFLI